MSRSDPLEFKRIDREIKIAQLKAEAAEIGEFYPDEIWDLIYRFDHAPLTTDYTMLVEAGIEIPDPDSLEDDELTAKLWEIIEHLAARCVVLSCTDHLSDRELYEKLVTEALHRPRPDVEPDPEEPTEIDLLGGFSQAEIELCFRHYLDDVDRVIWGPQYAHMPSHEEPPYDRDRWLPRIKQD